MSRFNLVVHSGWLFAAAFTASTLNQGCSDVEANATVPSPPSPTEDAGVDAASDATTEEDGGGPAPASFSGEVTCGASGPCVVGIAANAGHHICALLADKTVRCWGQNDRGQLGVAPSESEEPGVLAHSPEPVRPDGLSHVTQISVNGGAGGTSCARVEDGRALCWGSNSAGQLGLDANAVIRDANAHPTPTVVEGVPYASRIDLASGFACAVGPLGEGDIEGDGGGLSCWGANDVLQLGRGHLPIAWGTAGAVDLRFRKVLSAAGTSRVGFAIRDTGQLLSWGGNEWQNQSFVGVVNLRDALGRESSFSPDPIPYELPVIGDVTDLAGSTKHACIVAAGAVHCWGMNDTGAVGNSSRVDDRWPFEVTVQGARPIRNLSVSDKTTCAASIDGKAYCWGDNTKGQLGAGNADFTFEPMSVSGLGGRVVRLATMDETTCALIEDGTVECWGSNARGQLGIGTRDDDEHLQPTKVVF